MASNLPEGKYIKPLASTVKYYKVGQPCFQDKLQELNTDFAKICISPKPSGAPVGSKVQGPVSKPNSVGCYRQLNSSSLHKQTRRNPLVRDVHSPVEDHDLVPLLRDNIKSQTHSRVSECDGQPSVQVEPSPVNRMVTASAGVQTDLSQVAHSSCRSFCHSPEPQSSTIRVSSPRPKCLGHRCSEHTLVRSHCLCLPMALLHRVIQKSGNPVA